MKIYFSTILILILSAFVFAQNTAVASCDLQLEVYKFNASAAPAAVRIKEANVALKNSKTQKKIKTWLKTGNPFFPKIIKDDYEAVVSFPGYKTTSKKFSLNCGAVNTENVATEVIFLWEGNPKETVSMNFGSFSVGDDSSAPQQFKMDSPLASRPGTIIATPVYPPAALAVRATGAVRVQVLLDELGRVVAAEALDGHPLLRQAAENAARASKFTSTLLNGLPVRVSGVIVYNFGQ